MNAMNESMNKSTLMPFFVDFDLVGFFVPVTHEYTNESCHVRMSHGTNE